VRAAGAGAAVYERAADKLGQDWVTWLESNTDRTPQWHAALDAEKEQKKQFRDAEPDEKKALRKAKDMKYQEEKRAIETTQELNERRERNADSHRSRIQRDYKKKMQPQFDKDRLELTTSGGVYVYLCKMVQELIYNGKDWIWIQDKVSKEKFLASDFGNLSKRYAIIFKTLGFKFGDVLHLMVDNHYHNFFALGGCWHLGGTGSLPGTSNANNYSGQEDLSVGAIEKQKKKAKQKL
jgi:hypothetical protein